MKKGTTDRLDVCEVDSAHSPHPEKFGESIDVKYESAGKTSAGKTRFEETKSSSSWLKTTDVDAFVNARAAFQSDCIVGVNTDDAARI